MYVTALFEIWHDLHTYCTLRIWSLDKHLKFKCASLSINIKFNTFHNIDFQHLPQLDSYSSYHDLGVLFYTNLTWSAQLDHTQLVIPSKAYSYLGLLCCIYELL